MAESTELREHPLPRELAAPPIAARRRPWTVLKRGFTRSIFWSYARGSWQYDVICAVILAFIFFTPASWFHDRPTLGLTHLRHNQGIVEIGHTKEGWHYLVDARLVDSLAPRPPQQAVQEILQDQLHHPVELKSVEALRDRSNVLLGYTVVLTR